MKNLHKHDYFLKKEERMMEEDWKEFKQFVENHIVLSDGKKLNLTETDKKKFEFFKKNKNVRFYKR